MESPSQIFVCPANQIGLAEHLLDQIRAYVAAVGDKYLGAAPVPNHLCIAKSQEDEQWYRAVCCKEKGEDMYELMFVDYGNVEDVPRKCIMHIPEELMKTPILANHCVLEGFEDAKLSDLYRKVFADKIQELLPLFEEAKITVLRKLPNSSTFVVRIPHIAKYINSDLLQKEKEKSQDLKTRSTESQFKKLPETKVASNVKIDSSRMIMKSHMQQIDIDVGDDVIGLEFGSRDSTMIIQRILDAEKLKNVGILLKKCTKKINEEPKIGQMIACKWSEDDKIYRAEVISVFRNGL